MDFMCKKKICPVPCCFSSSSPPRSLLSLFRISLLGMSALSVSLSDMIRVSDITPRSRQRATRAGGGAWSQDAQPFRRVHGEKEPHLLSRRFVYYRATYKSPRIFLIYPISPFSYSRGDPWGVDLFCEIKVSDPPITDKTELVIQQILGLRSIIIEKIAPVHSEYRFAALCHSNDVISLKEINAPLFFQEHLLLTLLSFSTARLSAAAH